MKTTSSGLRNSFIAGFVPGLILPMIAILLIWWVGFSKYYFFVDWLNYAIRRGIDSEVLALGAVANLALFFLLMRIKWYWSARAAVLATFCYALVMVVLRFL